MEVEREGLALCRQTWMDGGDGCSNAATIRCFIYLAHRLSLSDCVWYTEQRRIQCSAPRVLQQPLYGATVVSSNW